MVQLINDPNRQTYGQTLSKSLSSALEGLASHKIGQMQAKHQQTRTAQGLEALLGIPSKEAHSLALLDPQLLEHVVKQKLQAPGEQAYASALQSILGGDQTQNAQPQLQSQVPQQAASELPNFTPKQRESLKRYVGSPEASKKHTPQELALLQNYLNEPVKPRIAAATPKTQELIAQVQSPAKAQALGGLNAKQATEIAKLGLEKQKMTAKEKREEKKAEFEERKFEHDKRTEAFKETKKEREAILEAAKSSRQNLHDLERLEELNKEGKLDTPGYVEFLKRSGLDIPALMNPESEEFQKIQQTFLKDAKTYLGSRISNFELEQFLKTIPSLSQSNQGRQRVIANLKRFSRVSLEYNNAMKEVVKENKGVPPLDLAEQVDDKVEKKMDHFAEQFKKEFSKPVPKEQNKLVTGLQSVLGSIAGAPGALLGGAGNLLSKLAL